MRRVLNRNVTSMVGVYNEGGVERLCAEVLRKACDFKPQTVANTLNALAKFDLYDKAVVETLCAQMVRKAGYFKPQNLMLSTRCTP